MIERIQEIEKVLNEIDSHIPEPTRAYLIGGGAMMYDSLKAFTKDLDMITLTSEEYVRMRDSLIEIGFESIKPTSEYCRFNLSNILQRTDGYRVDLFHRTVCNKLKLSDNMAKRAKLRYSGKNLSLYTCSPSDIIVFKSITDRDGDVEDCIFLIRSGYVDWNVVLDEIKDQVSTGEGIWITWMEEKMMRIHERSKIRIPILRELTGLSEDFIRRWEEEMISKLPEDER